MSWFPSKRQKAEEMLPFLFHLTNERFANMDATNIRRCVPDGRFQSRDERRAWEDWLEVRRARYLLIEAGWLPPRERDVLKRSGSDPGTLLAGQPITFTLKRTYTRVELGLFHEGYD